MAKSADCRLERWFSLFIWCIFFISEIFVILPHMYIRYLYGELTLTGPLALWARETALPSKYKPPSCYLWNTVILTYTRVINRESFGEFIGYSFCFYHWNIRNSLMYTLSIGRVSLSRALLPFGPVRRLCPRIYYGEEHSSLSWNH